MKTETKVVGPRIVWRKFSILHGFLGTNNDGSEEAGKSTEEVKIFSFELLATESWSSCTAGNYKDERCAF
jgi:hypothetical protein